MRIWKEESGVHWDCRHEVLLAATPDEGEDVLVFLTADSVGVGECCEPGPRPGLGRWRTCPEPTGVKGLPATP